ncbi:MAG: hypothetical protein E4H08_10275 [Candidatus Atribacteria bacterium]|nr:MAG: hypothetical protein E4H08_10275 [Candidatus Atribacteria bacterium]
MALPVAVAMEGYNGYARPLDRLVQEKGYRLFNVNNLKLARFKGVFPGAAKTDPIDTRKILELFRPKDQLPMAKDAIQEVVSMPLVNEKLKRLSRRRRRLVIEKMRVLNRMQADLQAVCPELLAATNDADNLWFLRLLIFREDLRQLARLSVDGIMVRLHTPIMVGQAEERYSIKLASWPPLCVLATATWAFGNPIEGKRILDPERFCQWTDTPAKLLVRAALESQGGAP